MGSFNLEQALAGAPVRTRDGRKVTGVALAGDLDLNTWVVTAKVGKKGTLLVYTTQGVFTFEGNLHPTDLVMGPTPPTIPTIPLAFFAGAGITYLVTELLKL